MAYANFKATIWSKYIQREIERKCRLVEWCWKEFEGEAKKGERVKITGIGPVTIGDYTGADIADPEAVEDASVYIDIDQAKYFNFAVDDIDKAQATDGLFEAISAEAIHRMARARDSFVAGRAVDAGGKSASAAITTAAGAKTAIDTGILYLRENDVDIEDDVIIELVPFLYNLFKDKLVELKTNNDELIKKGIVGMYDNCYVRVSNNLYNDGTDYYSMIRTKRAIAFAGGISETEAYRPEKRFSDALKGLNVYGGKVVRPKELYAIKARKS